MPPYLGVVAALGTPYIWAWWLHWELIWLWLNARICHNVHWELLIWGHDDMNMMSEICLHIWAWWLHMEHWELLIWGHDDMNMMSEICLHIWAWWLHWELIWLWLNHDDMSMMSELY